VDLPEFAAFPLVHNAEGGTLLGRYYAEYAVIAAGAGTGLLLETPTWRANPDWGRILGYDAAALDRANRAAVALVRAAVDAAEVPHSRVSGCGARAAMEELDAGDMPLLVSATKKLREELPAIAVLGGCCGADSRHVAALWGVDSSR